MSKPTVFCIGTLSTSQTTLAKVPIGKLWIVRGAVFHNSGGSSRAVSVYVRRSSTSRRIALNTLAAGVNVTFEEGWVLEEGDSIEGAQDAGADVTHWLYGLELDA